MPGYLVASRSWRHVVSVAVLAGAMASGRPSLAQTSTATDSSGIAGLPVVLNPVSGPSGSVLAVILSGDGGWAAGDKQMAAALVRKGIPVVGFDTPSYLRTARTPEGVASDIGRLLEHYLEAWQKQQVLLIGYSHGADLAPFMVSRWNDELRRRILLLAFLGLEHQASFQFHVMDLIPGVGHPADLPVLPEVEKLRGLPILCVQGADETNSLCASLDSSLARVETRAGGHRITGSEGADVVDMVLAAARGESRAGS
jgi:type IV secretory pathway VirJ component